MDHGLSAINFQNLFGNTNPVEIEIGCGKGKFLVTRAAENPSINFLGLDRVMKWMKIGLKKSENRHLTNLFFLQAESREYLDRVPDQSVKLFHIYFPDPWPKRRHRKRRLVTADFLSQLEKKLEPQGAVELATDDADYFEQMKNASSSTVSLWRSIRVCRNERIQDPHIKTNYELKYEAAGRPLHYLELVKP